jgi:hypothetical protein
MDSSYVKYYFGLILVNFAFWFSSLTFAQSQRQHPSPPITVRLSTRLSSDKPQSGVNVSRNKLVLKTLASKTENLQIAVDELNAPVQ